MRKVRTPQGGFFFDSYCICSSCCEALQWTILATAWLLVMHLARGQEAD